MKGKVLLILFIIIVLMFSGMPAALAAWQSGTGETTKIWLLDAANPTAAPVLYPDGQEYVELNGTYSVGDTFTVYANVTDVTNCGSYAVGVIFNNTILEATSFTEGEFFYRVDAIYRTNPVNLPIKASGVDSAYPTLSFAHVSWGLLMPGNVTGTNTGTLAEFNFKVVGSGVTKIHIITTGAKVAKLKDGQKVDLNFNTIDIIFDNSPVGPPPAKIWLLDAANPTATPVLYPDGQEYIELNDTYSVGDTFTVYANVTDVTNCGSYAVGATYDNTILQVTSFTEGEFFYRVDAAYRTAPVNQPIKSSGAGELGFWNHVTWGLLIPGNVTGTATGTLAEFEFTVIGYGVTKIHIITTGAKAAALKDGQKVPIDFNTIDIIFVSSPVGPPPTNIYVDPATSTVEAINNTFNVNITVSDIKFLASWQAGMSFNPDVLECLAFEEGDFLSNVGTTETKRLGANAEIDNFLGKLAPANCSLTDPSLSASGTGTLATVTFKVKDYGLSTLNITYVMLLDVNDEQIIFDAVGGEFEFLFMVHVPADYPTIQEAVNSVSPGQTIRVAPGTYHERLTINKSLTLIGEEGAKIDGSGGRKVVKIITNNFSISGFTIQNGLFGIFLNGSYNSITHNTILNNWCGVYMLNSKNNSIRDNMITSNYVWGIRMFGSCRNNIVSANVIAHSKIGLYLTRAINNTFYHNNITNNEVQLNRYKSSNTWDNGMGEGNYWSDYTGEDENGDGIGDTLLPHQGVDYYPLMSQLDTEPPWADAGPDQTVDEDTLVNFDGSASTDNTGITSYEWSFGDGSTGTGVIVNHTYPEPGVYSVTLTVWDKVGYNNTDSCIITVHDVTPPVADAGPDQTVPKCTNVTFNGGGSYDPEDGAIVKFEWNLEGEIIGTLMIVNYSFAELGVYSVTLTVWDAGPWRNGTDPLRNDTDSCTVTVTGVDMEPPVADAGPDQTVDEDTLVTLNGSSSTDNVCITSYTWTFTDVTLQTLTGVNPTYTFTKPATYTITLNVTDAAGHWAIDTVVITVLDVTPPVADAGLDQTVDEDTIVTLEGSASYDPEGGTITEYEWDFGDGTSGTGVTPTHTYVEPGVYSVTLTVWDKADNEGADSCSVTVLDVTPPVADAGPEQKVVVGETVVFNGSGSTDNVGVISFEWDFGDETTGTGSIINHVYTEQGEYTATLTVKDAAGNSATDSITIHVKTPPSGFPLWIVGATAAGVTMIALGALVAYFVLGRRARKTNDNFTNVACAFWALRATCAEGSVLKKKRA